LTMIFIPLNFHNGLMAVLFIPLIYFISCNNGFLTKIFSLKPLEYLGEISYAVYIVHIPVLYILRMILWEYFKVYESNAVFWVYMIILLFVSALFYQFIEKPLREYLKKLNIR
jgi:peptidoglycan/LPS O-acetylase OafA/YrhL